MNEKVTLQDIAASLAERQNMQYADAEAFVKAFFAVAEEMLACDRYVRVKGLGTFRLLDVHSCNVAGAKTQIGIDGCEKISFEPDAALRDLINKPFSQFEMVQLKDGVHFDDLEEGEEVPVQQPEPLPDQTSIPESGLPEPDSGKSRVSWWMLVAALFIGVLVGGGIVWTFVFNRQNEQGAVVELQDTVRQNIPFVSMEKLPDKYSFSREDTVCVLIPVKEMLSDTVAYETGGTQASYTLRAGESLAKVAQKFYGNKKLWPYLVGYNRAILPDPDRIPVGTTIRIPVLVPKNEFKKRD